MAEYNEGVKALRAKLMKADQVMGLKVKQLAEKYNCSPGEVMETLEEGTKAGVLALIEREMFQTLMPKALAVLEAHLDQGESLKAVELTMAMFGAVKGTVKATKGFEISLPSDTRAVGIVALDQIRQERQIHAPERQRHDQRPEDDDPGGEDPPGDLPSLRRKH